MPLTIRQKCMGGVMLAAMAAFAWDRAHARQAEAQPAASAGEEAQRTDAPAKTVAVVTGSSPVRLGVRIAQLAQDQGLDPLHADDAFSLPGAWPTAKRVHEASPPPATAPAGPTELEIDHALADTFVRKHRLDAVMAQASGGYAILDGACVRVGESVDHFKLKSVTASSAVFQRHRIRIEIRINPKTDLRADGSTIDNRPLKDAGE